jgi:hypothetical protein
VISSTYSNPRLAVDTSNDGRVTAFDVLLVINEITRRSREGTSVPPEYAVDTSNDGLITAFDVLLVINYITEQNRSFNGQSGGEGEDVQVSPALASTPHIPVQDQAIQAYGIELDSHESDGSRQRRSRGFAGRGCSSLIP